MINKTISQVSELADLVAELRAQDPSRGLVFRGQRSDVLPTPSAHRKLGDKTQAILQSSWINVASHLLRDDEPHANELTWILKAMAIFQHYGFSSWFIDVTLDSQIAAWFAVHDHISEDALISPPRHYNGEGQSPYRCDHVFAAATTARYERAATDGHLLIFGISSSDPHAFFLEDGSKLGAERHRAAIRRTTITPLGWSTAN